MLDTIENDVWFPTEQPNYTIKSSSYEQDAQNTDDIINLDALEKLILNTTTVVINSRKQKRLKPRPNTYGSIVSCIVEANDIN
jgi:hypothetical protein